MWFCSRHWLPTKRTTTKTSSILSASQDIVFFIYGYRLCHSLMCSFCNTNAACFVVIYNKSVFYLIYCVLICCLYTSLILFVYSRQLLLGTGGSLLWFRFGAKVFCTFLLQICLLCVAVWGRKSSARISMRFAVMGIPCVRPCVRHMSCTYLDDR